METRLGSRIYKPDDVLPASNSDPDVRDHCNLEVLNDATLLEATRVRFGKDAIYTYISEILLAVNPFKPLPHLYDADAKVSRSGIHASCRRQEVCACGCMQAGMREEGHAGGATTDEPLPVPIASGTIPDRRVGCA